MKTRKEIVTMIEVILMQEKADKSAYEAGRLSFRDYQRCRRDLKNRLDVLLWVIEYKGCYFVPSTVEETFDKASRVVAVLSDNEAAFEELPFN